MLRELCRVAESGPEAALLGASGPEI